MQVNNLYLSNFPTHDMAADFVLLAEQWQTAEGALKDQYEVMSPWGQYRVGGSGVIWGSALDKVSPGGWSGKGVGGWGPGK